MKKITLTLALLVSALMIFAQDNACSIGLQLGFSQSIYRCNSPSNDDLGKVPLNGGKIGFVFEGNIIKGFGAYLALNYTYGGGTTQWQKDGELPCPRSRYRNYFHALELACDWQYKFAVAQNTYIILYSGPTVQCNLSFHEQKFTQETPNGPINPVSQGKDQLIRKVETGDKDYKAYNRLNVTWGVGAGFQYDRYYIRGGYDFGLINPYSYENFNEVSEFSRPTRGREDQWYVKLGIYLWQSDN